MFCCSYHDRKLATCVSPNRQNDENIYWVVFVQLSPTSVEKSGCDISCLFSLHCKVSVKYSTSNCYYNSPQLLNMMTSLNGNIFLVLAFCAGNSPGTGEFLGQKPATQNLNVFVDLHLTIRLSRQSSSRWFETPSHQFWRHCNTEMKHVWANTDFPSMW